MLKKNSEKTFNFTETTLQCEIKTWFCSHIVEKNSFNNVLMLCQNSKKKIDGSTRNVYP